MLIGSRNGFAVRGGSQVSITPSLDHGVKIADYSIGKSTGVLYAPGIATSAIPGLVQPDETTITIDASGVISSNNIYVFNTPEQIISTTDQADDTVSIELHNGAMNAVSLTGDVSYLNIDFPEYVTGYSRNFVLCLTCDTQTPQISTNTLGVSLYAKDSSELTPGSGENVFSFIEFGKNKFKVSKENLQLVSQNLPVSVNQLMSMVGVSENSTMDDVRIAWGLTDDNTVEDAVNAALG